MTEAEKLANIHMTELRDMIAKIERELKDAPEGTLLVVRRRGYCEYYQRIPAQKGQKEQRIYISKKDLCFAGALARKDYNLQALRLLKEAEQAAAILDAAYPERALAAIYEELDPERKCFISPLITPTAQFVKDWLNEPYAPGSFRPEDSSSYFTDRGERVRSKSEVIIANALFHAGIPYKYEYPHVISGKIFRPDFTVLNVRTRREFILEHFGMLGDPDYLNRFQSKMDFYILNGIMPGRDLLFTLESSSHTLDTRVVMRIIEEYLK